MDGKKISRKVAELAKKGRIISFENQDLKVFFDVLCGFA
jgi:hypothetical protein